ncbi:hypothetical protein NBRC110019_12490 [Neptunitalea chrysea]|uniref:Cytochrome c domain-containing protein n=1 Tax=Neptunitalea chrysea TaxID=1647581 RepID=A0A9W6B491_9FLAO|nr:cytochrome c [Neptunitalea chrysea]GLB52210.1 hypothetical protein NBRC110019_12490 [Neptunitalea chrysea]
MKKSVLYIVLFTGFFVSCTTHTYEDITGDPVVIEDDVTYTANVKSIIDANCVNCHAPGQTASFRLLTNYTEVVSAMQNTNMLDRIQRQNGESGLMPANGRMSQNNIDIILQWNEDGLQ